MHKESDTAYKRTSNQAIARVLTDIANLLEIQHANPFRIRAYRSGANVVRKFEEPVQQIVFSGDGQALQDLPGIGESLSAVIEEYVKTGKSQLLNRLKGAVSQEEVFEQVPGIGKGFAERIARELNIKTLEDLELAAHDGRLARIDGFGKRRLEAVRTSLAGMLSGFAQRRQRHIARASEDKPLPLPTVAQLLEVDAEYRKKAAADKLKKIAPKRFNPGKVAWLPVLHTEKGDWSFTAMFSNTARAHELDKIDDWVVIFFEKNGFEGQSTVVTETSGALKGKRVVRGRESENRFFH
ncbi:MAG: helix-hairpin-helix domain-containing protein [Saprospiraceae bacterium]|nr:helix-hairpin-helix domain-containing protein [Saprospiraceae bacterium]